MGGCCVPNCRFGIGLGIKTFQIPNPEKQPKRFQKWSEEIQIYGLTKSMKLCELHFDTNQFLITNGKYHPNGKIQKPKFTLRNDAVPSIFPHRNINDLEFYIQNKILRDRI